MIAKQYNTTNLGTNNYINSHIVLTTYVFDVLHPWHTHLFRTIKNKYRLPLIAGINRDSNASELNTRIVFAANINEVLHD